MSEIMALARAAASKINPIADIDILSGRESVTITAKWSNGITYSKSAPFYVYYSDAGIRLLFDLFVHEANFFIELKTNLSQKLELINE